MGQDKLILIEIAYASTTEQHIIAIYVTPLTTIREAILQSNILSIYPDIDLEKQKVGIFSKIKKLSYIVKAGDRIEIYRPLRVDPKDARRTKAKKQQKLQK